MTLNFNESAHPSNSLMTVSSASQPGQDLGYKLTIVGCIVLFVS